MKNKMLLLLLFMPIMSFAAIHFPDSLLLFHKETGYKLLIGTSPDFVERHFGKPLQKILQFKFTSPDYEIWDMIYDGFEIRYETFDMMVTGVTILNDSFYLSNNISIYSSLNEVMDVYGNPNHVTKNKKGEMVYQYMEFIREINIEGEYTLIQFKFISNRMIEILVDIVPDV